MVTKTGVWFPIILLSVMLIFGQSMGLETGEKHEDANTGGDADGGSVGGEGNVGNGDNGSSAEEAEREDGTEDADNASSGENGDGNVDDADKDGSGNGDGDTDADDSGNRKDDDNLTERNANIVGLNITVKARTSRNIVIEEVTTERFNEIVYGGEPLGDSDADYTDNGDGGEDNNRDPRGFGIMFNVSVGDGKISDIHLNIDIREKIPSDVDESRIRLYWFDEDRGTWTKIENSSYDPGTGYLSANIDHLTIFAPMEEPSEKKGAVSDENSLPIIIVVVATVMAVFLVVFLAMKRKMSRDGEGEEEQEEGNDETDDGLRDESTS